MQLIRMAVLVCAAALAGCADRSFSPTTPSALDVGTPKTVFAATTRTPRRDGHYGAGRSYSLDLLELTVSIPPDHQPGKPVFGYRNPDPAREFTIAGRHAFETPQAFNRRLKSELASLPADQREVTVFVHGYNSTQAETAYRAAQLSHDIRIPGATVVYSWPSKGRPLGYAYDGDSVLFARDGLEELLRQLRAGGIREIVLVAHSMGSQLVMEALRQIEIATPGWSAANLNGIVLFSPDLDVEVFRTQIGRFQTVPQPFLVFVSRRDNVLTLSQRLRGLQGRRRLGNLDNIEVLKDLPVDIIDATEFAGEAGSRHFVAATSPALIALLGSAREAAEALHRERFPTENLLPGRVVIGESAVQISLANPLAGAR
ncbi:alpha/beta hydrolase [Roseobacteraceae bacterium NS-SX3]